MSKRQTNTTQKTGNAVTVPNIEVLSIPPAAMSAVLGEFLSQPLPILAMMDIRMACDSISAASKALSDANVELIKRYGGTEEPVGSGTWRIAKDSAGWAGYKAEYDKLAAASTSIPLPSKVRLPRVVRLQSRDVDLVMSGAASGILAHVVEVERG